MKIALAIILSGLTTLDAGHSQTPASPLPSPTLATGIFVVRPDPRECPSPMCGGYWVSLANHARTKCGDGLLRPRCYVAAAETEKHGETQLPAYGLARGVLGSRQFGGLGELGVLTVSATWDHAGEDLATGDFFRVRDTGVRCIRAPCFSFRAALLNQTTRAIRVSSVDLTSTLDVSPDTRRRAQVVLRSRDGLLAAGSVVRSSDGGRLFRASQVYFREPQPRA